MNYDRKNTTVVLTEYVLKKPFPFSTAFTYSTSALCFQQEHHLLAF